MWMTKNCYRTPPGRDSTKRKARSQQGYTCHMLPQRTQNTHELRTRTWRAIANMLLWEYITQSITHSHPLQHRSNIEEYSWSYHTKSGVHVHQVLMLWIDVVENLIRCYVGTSPFCLFFNSPSLLSPLCFLSITFPFTFLLFLLLVHPPLSGVVN